MSSMNNPDVDPGRKATWLPDYYHQPVTRSFIVWSLASSLIGGPIAWQFIWAGEHEGPWAVGILLAASLGILFVHIIVHEVGHLSMALLVQLRVYRMKLGPLILDFSQKPVRVQWHWPPNQPLGYVVAVPMNDRAIGPRMLAFVCGGPLASLLTGVGLLLLASHFDHPAQVPEYSSSWDEITANSVFSPKKPFTIYLNLAGLAGLALACATLTPMRTTGFSTDGAHLWNLLKRSKRTEGNVLLAALSGNMQRGARPRDWDQDTVARLLACRDGSQEDSVGNLYGYYWALDSRRIDLAKEYLELALAQHHGYPTNSRSALFLEGAYFEARHNFNVAAAFGWLADANHEQRVEEQTHCRAEAALLWARGQHAEGAGRAEAGLKAIPLSADLGGRQAEQEWLEDLLNLCLKETPEPATLTYFERSEEKTRYPDEG